MAVETVRRNPAAKIKFRNQRLIATLLEPGESKTIAIPRALIVKSYERKAAK